MSRLISIPLALVALVILAGPASAGAPTREFVPAPDFTVDPGPCPFALDIHTVADQEYSLTFTDANGNPVRQIVTGLLVVQIANHDTGTSIVRNISGPGQSQFFADGTAILSASGTWLFFFPPGMLGPGSPGSTIINTGFLQLRFNLDGTETILSRSGSVEDVCAALS
jgi:hypothetical protein